MRRQTRYPRTLFSPEAITEAAREFDRQFGEEIGDPRIHFIVAIGNDEWTHEAESEFFADYRRGASQAVYSRDFPNAQFHLQLIDSETTLISVAAVDRSRIQAVFEVLAKHTSACRLPDPPVPPPPKPVVFIGHGRSPAWRDLKDHLHEKHGYQVEAYEIGARAGHAIRDILEDMLARSSFAIMALTAEDETSRGSLRARQNVIHETGLFQGRLGFSRAIVLLEEGAEAFSNIEGIEQIRFARGNIRETFGDVVATLKREFEESAV